MDTVKSIKGYGKVDEAQDLAFKRKIRKKWFLFGITFFILVSIIISSVVIGVVIHNRNNKSPKPIPNSIPELTPAASLRTVCSVTRYPTSCFSSISQIPSSNTTDPEIIFRLSLKVVVDELNSISDLPKKLLNETEDAKIKSALDVCRDLLDDAKEALNETMFAMEVGDGTKILNGTKIDNLKTWLTAVLTDHDTCIDTLEEFAHNSTISEKLKSAMVNSTEYTSNSLAIVGKILSTLSDFGIPIHRRRLLDSDSDSDSFPDWVSLGVRRLLEDGDGFGKLTPNVTVAADGSGDVKTVNEAVEMVPKKGNSYFLIYVKEGIYVENVVLDKSKWNVMIYGDGKEKTIVSGNTSNADGFPTFKTATFATQGRGFIMKDIGIINTAGPKNGQAVALRSGSDLSVYYHCSFDGYQGTLYPHSNRQFYRDCDVTGTVDFIFGNAAVILQNCNIRPRQPLPGQFNTITAQGKTDPGQNSGISIQRCTISANGNVTAPSYLGRPWKEFSTAVIMESEIGSVIRPGGWLSWVSGTDPPSSILYGEFKNSGPGSGLKERVKWAGYKPVMSDAEAGRFVVATFIRGVEWLPSSGVPFSPY